MSDVPHAELIVTPPYRFDRLLTLLSRWRTPTVDHADGDVYRRAFMTREGPVLLEARAAGEDRLSIRIAAGPESDRRRLFDRLARVLAVESPLAGFWAWLDSAHPHLQAPLEPVWGLPLPRSDSLFEALIYTIIEQQISWVGAQRAQRAICEIAGQSIEYGGKQYWCAPEPGALAGLNVADLKPLKITDRRAGMLIRLASDAARGQLELDSLYAMDEAVRLKALLAVKGIGPWTALMIHLRAFGPAGAAPSNDVALQAAVRRYWAEHAGASDPVAAAFSAYGEHAGAAAALILSRWVIDRY